MRTRRYADGWRAALLRRHGGHIRVPVTVLRSRTRRPPNATATQDRGQAASLASVVATGVGATWPTTLPRPGACLAIAT